jgi:hypothetical protein
MEGTWLGQHWFDLLQSTGIVGGLLVAAYAAWKDEQARKVGNLIALNEQYRQIWKEMYERPQLARVLQKDPDIGKQPISNEERLFVNLIIMHLHAVWRASKARLFVTVEGLEQDVRGFFSLPIPRSVWGKLKALQNQDFAKFMDGVLK